MKAGTNVEGPEGPEGRLIERMEERGFRFIISCCELMTVSADENRTEIIGSDSMSRVIAIAFCSADDCIYGE